MNSLSFPTINNPIRASSQNHLVKFFLTMKTLSRTSDTCSDPDQVEIFIKHGQSKMAFLSLCFYITSQFQIKINAS